MANHELITRLKEYYDSLRSEKEIYHFYQDSEDRTYSVKAYNIPDQPNVGKIAVGVLAQDTGLSKWGDLVEIFVDLDDEGRTRGLKQINAYYYENPNTRYLLTYEKAENIEEAKLTKVIAGWGVLNQDEIEKLNLPNLGFPTQIDWVKTALMYTSGYTPTERTAPLNGNFIHSHPLVPTSATNFQR